MMQLLVISQEWVFFFFFAKQLSAIWKSSQNLSKWLKLGNSLVSPGSVCLPQGQGKPKEGVH